MKKLITALAGVVVLASLASMAFAQAAGPAGGGVQSSAPARGRQNGGAGPIGQKIIKQLGLTRPQMLQVKVLVTAFKQKRDQLVPAGSKPNPKVMAPLRKQFIEDFAKILTPDQREKMKTLMSERKKQGFPQTGAVPPPSGKSGGGN